MLELLAILIAIIIVFIIVYWLKKSLFIFGFFFRAFTFAVLLLIAISIVFGYLVIKDVEDFSNNFSNGTSIFILKDDVNNSEKFLTGVTITPNKKSFDTLSKTELQNVEELYKKDLLSTMDGDYYKIFVIDFKSFEDMEIEGIEDRNINLSKEEIRRIMMSNDAKEELAEIVSEQTGESKNTVMKSLDYDDEEIKSYIFSYYLSTTFNPDNMGKFLTQFKNDNVKVYEETALFKIIKFIPNFLMKTVTDKIESTVNVA